MSFLSAHNIILSRGQHVARELRVERVCSNICEFYARQWGKNYKQKQIVNIFIISGDKIFGVQIDQECNRELCTTYYF